MLSIRLVTDPGEPTGIALPTCPNQSTRPGSGPAAALLPPALALPTSLVDEATAVLEQVEHDGRPAALHAAHRPLGDPPWLLLLGVGAGDEAGWRAAGAALARQAETDRLTVAMPVDLTPAAVRGLAEGLWLGSYRFRAPEADVRDRPAATAPASGARDGRTRLDEVRLAVADPAALRPALDAARVTAQATVLARDLTNMPSAVKSPAWFAERVAAAAAEHAGLSLTVREPADLEREGFGGILTVGRGSARGPRLVELAWRPSAAGRHVVLVGKGITFDSGGISIKPRPAMKLMRKDMAGGAAVVAATLGAAAANLPIRLTTLVPLAENMPSGTAFRPGDIVRHYGGLTSESVNTDAEGRLVLADALAYAQQRLEPDLLIDLATLTGANAVALGRRTGALYSDNDELAEDLTAAITAAGEQVWRMPLAAAYADALRSDVADLYSAPSGAPGSVIAALYLREFTGDLRDRWAHIDMSAPSWSDDDHAELVAGATGWGVRGLLRWLEALARRT